MEKYLKLPDPQFLAVFLSVILFVGTALISYGQLKTEIAQVQKEHVEQGSETKELKQEIIELKIAINELKVEVKYANQRYGNPTKTTIQR